MKIERFVVEDFLIPPELENPPLLQDERIILGFMILDLLSEKDIIMPPSYREIAEGTDLSLNKIGRLVNKLVTKGYLTKKEGKARATQLVNPKLISQSIPIVKKVA